MKMNDLYPSKYLKAEDFAEGEERVVTMKDVDVEVFGEGAKAQNKPVLQLRDSKPLVLNKTNASIIAKLHGDDTADWFGKSIQLFAMDVQSFDDIVRAIRVRPRIPQQGAQQTPQNGHAPQAQAQPAREPAAYAPVMPPRPANEAQIVELRELGRKVFGATFNAELRTRVGSEPTFDAANIVLDELRKAVAPPPVAAQPVPATGSVVRGAFDDDFDDNDPFADQ